MTLVEEIKATILEAVPDAKVIVADPMNDGEQVGEVTFTSINLPPMISIPTKKSPFSIVAASLV